MRPHSTYRSARRNDWRALNKWLGDGPGHVSWEAFNQPKPEHQIGTRPAVREVLYHKPANRSKYMPHIGAKERGRYA